MFNETERDVLEFIDYYRCVSGFSDEHHSVDSQAACAHMNNGCSLVPSRPWQTGTSQADRYQPAMIWAIQSASSMDTLSLPSVFGQKNNSQWHAIPGLPCA